MPGDTTTNETGGRVSGRYRAVSRVHNGPETGQDHAPRQTSDGMLMASSESSDGLQMKPELMLELAQ